MIPKHIIEKAIEGGWDAKGILKEPMAQIESIDSIHEQQVVNFQWARYDYKKQPCKITREMFASEIIFDPSFWQSLGKALGWTEREAAVRDDGLILYKDEWIIFAHCFFDLLLTGDDTEKFWSDLIKS